MTPGGGHCALDSSGREFRRAGDSEPSSSSPTNVLMMSCPAVGLSATCTGIRRLQQLVDYKRRRRRHPSSKLDLPPAPPIARRVCFPHTADVAADSTVGRLAAAAEGQQGSRRHCRAGRGCRAGAGMGMRRQER